MTTAGASPIAEPLADAGTPAAPESLAGPASRNPPVPWTDLARNLPGQGPAARAARLRAADRAGTLLARILGRHTDERAWRLGASGEVAVGRRLARLSRPWRNRLVGRPQQWWVLHSIPVGSRGADIDHLVIGPGGVFSINAKHHPGARVWVGNHSVQVNGRPTDYVRLARHEADRASRLLSAAAGRPVRVTPVLAVVGTGVTGRRRAVGEVQVLPVRSLVRALRRRPPDLGPDEVRQLYETARRSTTWNG